MDDFNLADLAGLDTTNVQEVRIGEKIPEGIYDWGITEPSMEDDHIEENNVKIQRLKALFKLTILDVREVKEQMDQATKEKLVGKTFIHAIVRKMPAGKEERAKALEEFVGLVKGFLIDSGCSGNGKIGDLLAAANGKKFTAPIKYAKNKNDIDNPYVNLSMIRAKTLA